MSFTSPENSVCSLKLWKDDDSPEAVTCLTFSWSWNKKTCTLVRAQPEFKILKHKKKTAQTSTMMFKDGTLSVSHPASWILALQPQQHHSQLFPLALVWCLLQQFFSPSQHVFNAGFLLTYLAQNGTEEEVTLRIRDLPMQSLFCRARYLVLNKSEIFPSC